MKNRLSGLVDEESSNLDNMAVMAVSILVWACAAMPTWAYWIAA